MSDWYPHIAKHADDLAVIRSCWADGLNHVGSVCQMNTGAIIAGRPSLGAWLTYGLGTANENLPTFVILTDSKSVVGGAQNWSSGFLPATYQGTLLQREGPPILHLKRPERIGDAQQRGMLDLLLDVNRHHAAGHSGEEELDARMESYELAYRMQTAAPEAVDLSEESELTKKLYGLDDPATEPFGKNCLMARRLVERGVRFVELYCGSGSGWDAHQDMEGNHSKWCRASDRPDRGTARRSESSRLTGRHSGGLGRRIRPHAVQREGRWTRSQPLGLHYVDGRGRNQGRPDDRHYRRDRFARCRQAISRA